MDEDGLSRREFLAATAMAAASAKGMAMEGRKTALTSTPPQGTVFRSLGGGPVENTIKVLDMAGGIAKMVEEDAVVLVKPNLQWFNQGAPNLEAMETLVSIIMERPGGFRGEVVIGENCHRGPRPWESAGWTSPFERNAGKSGPDTALGLCGKLKERFGDRFSVRHWVNVRIGGKRIFTPADGEGYVYCDGTGGVPLLSCDNGVSGDKARKTIMTYPVFNTDRGTVVDFKNGIWEKGAYTGRPFRFINLAALNHHSVYCGVTSAVKNHFGVVDLSGGPDPFEGGRISDQYFNFHSFSLDKWDDGPVPGALGKAVGVFMATIRRPDFNIVTAEWVGLVSRTALPAARTGVVLASTDPVALDFHSAKYLLFPNSGISIHNPERKDKPLWTDLGECAKAMGGVIDETQVEVVSWDQSVGRMQDRDNLVVLGKVHWGSDPKMLMKYVLLRVFG